MWIKLTWVREVSQYSVQRELNPSPPISLSLSPPHLEPPSSLTAVYRLRVHQLDKWCGLLSASDQCNLYETGNERDRQSGPASSFGHTQTIQTKKPPSYSTQHNAYQRQSLFKLPQAWLKPATLKERKSWLVRCPHLRRHNWRGLHRVLFINKRMIALHTLKINWLYVCMEVYGSTLPAGTLLHTFHRPHLVPVLHCHLVVGRP